MTLSLTDTLFVHRPSPGSAQWLHVNTGDVLLQGERLKASDGTALENAGALETQSLRKHQFECSTSRETNNIENL